MTVQRGTLWRVQGRALALLLLSAAAPTPVTMFHGDGRRSGAYVEPALDFAHAVRMHRDVGFDGVVSGMVYGQPLYWRGPGRAGGLVIAATETNHLTALDAVTGTVVWDRVLGPPVPDGVLPCGNVAPLGVTGTPVIDAAAGTLYLVAEVDGAAGPRALAFGVALADGAVRPGWPVDIGAGVVGLGRIFDALTQGQRGALSLLDGRLYVPFGGRSGDCASYHGWMVGLDLARPAVDAAWSTRALRGGIWATGGAATADGALFVTTGNTLAAAAWGDGESVIRLGPDLDAAGADRFTPTDWAALDENDLDLGGTGPLPLDIDGRGLILALGKDGKAYLLDRARLGGLGGALLVATVSGDQIRTAPATWEGPHEAFVGFARRGQGCPASRQGLTALRVTLTPGPAIAIAWCAALEGAGSPIVTTTDGEQNRILWVVGADGDDRLHGFDADTGATVFAGGGAAEHMTRLHYTATILAAEGRLYVPADGRIFAFTP